VRVALQVGGLVLATWILTMDVRSGSVQLLGAVIGAATIAFAGLAIAWRPAWLGVAALFVLSAVVPVETSTAGFVLLVIAVFDTGAHRPAGRALAVLGGGLVGLLIDGVVGSQDPAATVAFAFVVIAVSTVGSLVRTQAERVDAVEELALLRRQVERTGLARDMHDIVAAPMSHVVLISTDLLNRDGVPEELRSSLQVVQTEARESLEELRAMLAFLRSDAAAAAVVPSTPDAVSREWQASLERLATRGFTPEAHFEMALPAEQTECAELLRLAVRELTTNVLRHSSPPGRVRMSLVATARRASVVIANRLAGPAHVQLPPSGLGLTGLRERAEACGGQLLTTRMDDEWLAVLNVDLPVAA
jgi:signal transduction histidine kinase